MVGFASVPEGVCRTWLHVWGFDILGLLPRVLRPGVGRPGPALIVQRSRHRHSGGLHSSGFLILLPFLLLLPPDLGGGLLWLTREGMLV